MTFNDSRGGVSHLSQTTNFQRSLHILTSLPKLFIVLFLMLNLSTASTPNSMNNLFFVLMTPLLCYTFLVYSPPTRG